MALPSSRSPRRSPEREPGAGPPGEKAFTDWHLLDVEEACAVLGTDPAGGLDPSEVPVRLAREGLNELEEREGRGFLALVWDQIGSALVLLLVVAAAVSAALGDVEDAVAIAVILVLNAALGFAQEYRAEQALALLKRMAVPHVAVRRRGRVIETSAREIVPGDIVLLEAGGRVPADGRVIDSASLRIEESALTGESEPADKTPTRLARDVPTIADRCNMAYMGTTVVYGRGAMVVTATGMRTELGRVAGLIRVVERQATPLQRRLDDLGRRLAGLALALVAVLFAVGLARGEDVTLVFLTAVSLAVAAVPEGLPAVVTIALALGARRMLRRRALIRKLTAVETLGAVTVICSDKTGTLTENRMTATIAELPGRRLDLTSDEAENGGEAAALLLIGGTLCNDARPAVEAEGPGAIGDPTETALVTAAARAGFDKAALDRALPRVDEVPFDSDRKRMTTVHQMTARAGSLGGAAGPALAAWPWIAFTKGALEAVLARSTSIRVDGRDEPMTGAWREQLQTAHDGLAAGGMRVLAVAFRSFAAAPAAAALEHDLTFAGMIGLIDPPRAAVREAVGICRTAGIRPVMITGDHPLTATAVARAIGLPSDGDVVTGGDLAVLPAADLPALVARAAVYARVQPEQKLDIVRTLQAQGQVVAMTGDGVNDAPALKRADIGVAMGITGTDVAKDAADMVLQDDDFSTIVAAVEEGRVIFDNIRKFIRFILASNFGEILVMLVAPALGMPLPLLPIQILWINLLTDGLPALALSVEPAEPDTMQRPPYPPAAGIFDRGTWRHIVWIGMLLGAVSVAPGWWAWSHGAAAWQTIVFTTLTLGQLAQALAVRSSHQSLGALGLFSNRPLLASVAGMVLLQLAAIYVPIVRPVLGTVPLTPGDLGLCVGLSVVVLLAVEGEKALARRRRGSAGGGPRPAAA